MTDPILPDPISRGPISLGLVGLGTIARSQHLPALKMTPGLQLVAIASRNAAHDDLPTYHDMEEMLAAEPTLQAVSLCTPPQGRFAQAILAIRAGKHVMLEKPPGASVSEVQALARLAGDVGVTLFATWHSREAAAVEEARRLLAHAAIGRVTITWKEDVKCWHPGQEWIWQPGGLGVFDPGINALCVLTRILPEPVRLDRADLEIPENRQTPIAARLAMETTSGVAIAAEFDWRQTGPPIWDIRVETDSSEILLREGGARLLVNGTAWIAAEDHEYRRLYARFGERIAAGQSEVDLAPLQLVADAFLMGAQHRVAPFRD